MHEVAGFEMMDVSADLREPPDPLVTDLAGGAWALRTKRRRSMSNSWSANADVPQRFIFGAVANAAEDALAAHFIRLQRCVLVVCSAT